MSTVRLFRRTFCHRYRRTFSCPEGATVDLHNVMAPVGSPKPTSHIVLRIVRVVISCVQDSTEKDRESPLEIWHFMCSGCLQILKDLFLYIYDFHQSYVQSG